MTLRARGAWLPHFLAWNRGVLWPRLSSAAGWHPWLPGALLNISTDETSDDLRGRQVLFQAELFKHRLLSRIDQDRESGRALFHDSVTFAGIIISLTSYHSQCALDMLRTAVPSATATTGNRTGSAMHPQPPASSHLCQRSFPHAHGTSMFRSSSRSCAGDMPGAISGMT